MTEQSGEQRLAETDAALGRLDEVLGRIGDGDLHLAHPSGGWTAAQIVSHVNLSTLVWVAALDRLRRDPDLTFIFREEVGHDVIGYPPPTPEVARRQLANTRRTLTTCVSAAGDVLDREVTVPDIGTMPVADLMPLILGHLDGHVEQVIEVLRSRGGLPAE